jgi:hypothetical protein
MAATAISERLLRALDRVDRPGSFCMQGSAPAVLPGLDIRDVGPVGFPLTVKQAKEIKKHCEQAPYGKGEQTLVDTRVRRVWQMMPDRFQLTNPDWPAFLAQTVKTVQEELGLENQKLEAQLYNLLLYEKGSFFLPHRDGEKLDRMIATLVVVLPSNYEGGELVIRHEGQERTLDCGSGKDSNFRTHFAAFYADCEHEVRPMRAGYRLCLVYNLTLARAKKTVGAPRTTEHVEKVREVLRDWVADEREDSPRKLAVTLAHQYTQDGLAWDALKGVDRARAQVLREAARQEGCKAYLALLTFWESGSAADDGWDYHDRRRRWYDDYDDEDDDSGGHEMEEVYETSLTAEHWTDEEGNRLPLGKMTVAPEEVGPEDLLRGVEPEEDYQGYTGNEGMTLERWYRHAAVFLWPEKRHFEVVCGCGTDNPVAALGLLVKQWQKAGRKQQAALKAQCLDFARHLLAHWRPKPEDRFRETRAEPGELVPILVQLDEPALIKDLLSQVMARDASVEATAPLLKACERHGWSTFQDALVSLFRGTTAGSLPRNVRLLEQLCAGKGLKKPERLDLCGQLARELITALDTIDRQRDDWWVRAESRLEILPGLVRALLAAGQDEALARLLAHVAATPKRYPLREVQIPALVDLGPWLTGHLDRPSPPLSQWLAACREQLEALTAEKPQPPADFRRDADVSCKCEDCRELVQFLKDPHEQVHRFSVRKERRRHLHQVIDSHQCDLEHVTDRRGSPQTLVCTKNTASFQRRLRQYQLDQEHLKALRALEAKLPRPGSGRETAKRPRKGTKSRTPR